MSFLRINLVVLGSTILVNTLSEGSQPLAREFQIPHNLLNKRLTKPTIGTVLNSSLGGCARECSSLKACKAISFNAVEKRCELHSVNSTEANPLDWVTENRSVFSDITIWPKEIVRSCANEPCTSLQKCVLSENYRCLRGTSWCGNPPDVEHATYDMATQTKAAAGDTRRYTCDARYVMTSNSATVTCQSDSTWSPEQFRCIAECGTPPTVANAVISPGLETENETRTYTCQGFYVSNTSQTTITCQADTYWSDVLFSCKYIDSCTALKQCNPGYEDGGLYWLVLPNIDNSTRVRIQCLDMAANPSEYIYFPKATLMRYKPLLTSWKTGYIDSVRVSPETLRVDTSKFRGRGMTKCMSQYGQIFAEIFVCSLVNYEIRITLNGTGLDMQPVPKWVLTGHGTSVTQYTNVGSKTINVHGEIWFDTGTVKPGSAIYLTIDHNEALPDSAATSPVCV